MLAVDIWGHYLAIGSNVIQVVNMSSRELKRIKFFEENESIPVPDTVHVHLSGREIQLMCYPCFRPPHCLLTLLHLLVTEVTWPQQGPIVLWLTFGLHLVLTLR